MPEAIAARRRRDPDATVGAILAAVRQILAERGPDAVTVSDVAHRAGVNRTTAYQHFRTREDLVGAAAARIAEEVTRLLDAPMSLAERIDQMIGYALEHPEVARLWMRQMLAEAEVPSREGWERYLAAMHRLAASDRAQPGIDAEMLATILMAAVLAWSLRVRTELRDAREVRAATRRFARELKRLLLHGALRPEKSPELVAALKAPALVASAGGGAARGRRAGGGTPRSRERR